MTYMKPEETSKPCILYLFTTSFLFVYANSYEFSDALIGLHSNPRVFEQCQVFATSDPTSGVHQQVVVPEVSLRTACPLRPKCQTWFRTWLSEGDPVLLQQIALLCQKLSMCHVRSFARPFA
ncbi:uncharacterized protein M421DRAFT_91944 [Didymella exigua CBS 183.55]|uniref:Uncharacterized protein n=1 Tax=Didymella exigua CBS 183.55 TaxID=1150837 RepID=A0A6A5RNC3_9PLEO|nr:uncharacterized protein M421DRAFT_91944 [Didymella exigua CBS 183.55]KAF1928800.1 hypothetical protein M421DRAFT_91944 [Didymella exigua CBS 183.55]